MADDVCLTFLLKSISQPRKCRAAWSRMTPAFVSQPVGSCLPQGIADGNCSSQQPSQHHVLSAHPGEPSHLPKKMKLLNDDIKRFNTYVKVQLADLAVGRFT